MVLLLLELILLLRAILLALAGRFLCGILKLHLRQCLSATMLRFMNLQMVSMVLPTHSLLDSSSRILVRLVSFQNLPLHIVWLPMEPLKVSTGFSLFYFALYMSSVEWQNVEPVKLVSFQNLPMSYDQLCCKVAKLH
ncbi:uncharacterized protein LOC131620492 [Vicia villosa]|uniref:uncharacterized protein LOC131620492 n=1 Tax=Vicia villosa TaxID=3911 RepID=UPI00273CCB2F|nr:uncharacterized protein LOC131620492 [Vicia villosa]